VLKLGKFSDRSAIDITTDDCRQEIEVRRLLFVRLCYCMTLLLYFMELFTYTCSSRERFVRETAKPQL
jgi:hypothetical protein